jgi:transposase InsO family protein
MPDELVRQALLNAWANAPAPAGFVQSMSRKANCWDNAVAESFFATLEARGSHCHLRNKGSSLSGYRLHHPWLLQSLANSFGPGLSLSQ